MSEQTANRILVIDDESTHRILAKEYLEEAGYVVRLAEDAKRGLKLAMNAKPDLVLVDLMMPGMDGFEICQHLKANETTAHVPVILITASRESDVIARGFEVGVDDFVTKPVDWTFIADRVGLVLAIAQKKRRDLAEKEEMARQLQSVQEQAEHESRHGGFAESSSYGTDSSAGASSGTATETAEAVDARIRAVRQSAEAEMQGLEARYAAQMEAQQAEARATIEAASLAARRELEGVHLAHAKALMTARVEFNSTLEAEREKVRQEAETERAHLEQTIAALRAETDTAVRAARQDMQARYDAARQQHVSELSDVRAEAERRIHAIEAIAATQLQAAQSASAGEIATLRAQLQEIGAQRAQPAIAHNDDDLRATLTAESDARVRACWDIAQNLGNTHLDMVKSLLEKVRALREEADVDPSSGSRQGSRARFIEVEKATNALSTSLGSLRLLAYMMSGKAALDESSCDLGRLVRETVEKMKTLAAMNKVSLRADVPDRPVFAFADEPRIAYSLLLLTMNAIRHSPHGTTVTLSVANDQDGGLRITVSDQGVGIPQARLNLLRTCLDNPVGFADEQKFGFGIPIATAIARLHGASLEIDSALGSGTEAALRLPASRRRNDTFTKSEYRRSA